MNFLPSFYTVNKCQTARFWQQKVLILRYHSTRLGCRLFLCSSYIIKTIICCYSAQNGPDDNNTKSSELSPPVTASPSLVCYIDPRNGDNGCYSHQWGDQTVKGNPLLLQSMFPSAKPQPIIWFSREMPDENAVSIKKKKKTEKKCSFSSASQSNTQSKPYGANHNANVLRIYSSPRTLIGQGLEICMWESNNVLSLTVYLQQIIRLIEDTPQTLTNPLQTHVIVYPCQQISQEIPSTLAFPHKPKYDMKN